MYPLYRAGCTFDQLLCHVNICRACACIVCPSFVHVNLETDVTKLAADEILKASLNCTQCVPKIS